MPIVPDISLNNLQNSAVSGNTVIIQDGVYTCTGRLSMIGNNITVRSNTPGGVKFVGGNISIDISGNNNTLSWGKNASGSPPRPKAAKVIHYKIMLREVAYSKKTTSLGCSNKAIML